MATTIRAGVVSSFDAATGTAKVLYQDRNGQVTNSLQVYSPFGVAQRIEKGAEVIVLHLENGTEAAIVMGKYSGNGSVSKASIVGGDSLTVQCGDGFTASASGEMTFAGAAGTITLSELVQMKQIVLA